MPWTIGSKLANLRQRFEQCGLEDPQTDARTLLCGLLDIDLTDLVLKGGSSLNEADVKRIDGAAERRCLGEPVHRILGAREFFGLTMGLSSATLEPRPDTETLVNAALPIADGIMARRQSCTILDMGTGTGAICLALLHETAGATGLGSDVSSKALLVAQSNAQRNGLETRFATCHSNWFESVVGKFDLIVSNPPYIPSADIETLDRGVRDYDPHAALDGGVDGLDAYRILAARAGNHLANGGSIVLETGFDQHGSVIEIFDGAGYVCVARVKDLGGLDRVLVLERK